MGWTIKLVETGGQRCMRAIDRMVDKDIPCEDVLMQTNAAKSALHKAGQVVLEGQHCVREGCGGCVSAVSPPAQKGCKHMKIAVTDENGKVYGHFGHTEQFKIYDIVDGMLADVQVVPTKGSGHGALASFLAEQGVDCLICGGIGPGAQMALAEAGIRLYAGCSGDADQCVTALLVGTLKYAGGATCDHHGGDVQACGSHGCGEQDHACGQHCGN